MPAPIDQWKSDLLTLSPGERAELAHFLIESLEPEPDEDVDDEWLRELERRAEQIRSGAEIGRPVEEVLAELRAKHS